MGEGRWGDTLGPGFSDGPFLCVMTCESSEISGTPQKLENYREGKEAVICRGESSVESLVDKTCILEGDSHSAVCIVLETSSITVRSQTDTEDVYLNSIRQSNSDHWGPTQKDRTGTCRGSVTVLSAPARGRLPEVFTVWVARTLFLISSVSFIFL